MAPKKNYVLDTSVYLTDSEAIFKFNNHDVFIPLKVLEEIDNHKKRQDSVGVNARQTIRNLDELRLKGSLQKGVRIEKGKGLLRVMSYECLKSSVFPPDLDMRIPDHVIIATAKAIQGQYPDRKIIVVSRDINMRVICDSVGVPSETYDTESVVTSSEELYTGFSQHLVDDQLIDRFYNGDDIYIDGDEVKEFWSPNQYLMLVSNANEKKTALVRFKNYNLPLRKISEFKNSVWGLKPRNKEQMFALDVLLDPTIPIVTLVGKAGCGKTLLAIAAGLDQVLDQNIYKKLVVSRPVQPLGKDIGYLPGTMEEKMRPWLMPIQDNLDHLLNGKKDSMSMFFDNGTIQIEALTYIRGRSISNAFIIIDEAQNLTMHELKTIITRVGENTKIILTGDIEQIDSVYLDSTSNGLSYAVEKFKPHDLSGHITLVKGERSKVATLASKVL